MDCAKCHSHQGRHQNLDPGHLSVLHHLKEKIVNVA